MTRRLPAAMLSLTTALALSACWSRVPNPARFAPHDGTPVQVWRGDRNVTLYAVRATSDSITVITALPDTQRVAIALAEVDSVRRGSMVTADGGGIAAVAGITGVAILAASILGGIAGFFIFVSQGAGN